MMNEIISEFKVMSVTTWVYSLLLFLVILMLYSITFTRKKGLNYFLTSFIVCGGIYLVYRFDLVPKLQLYLFVPMGLTYGLFSNLISHKNAGIKATGVNQVKPFKLLGKGRVLIFNNVFRNFLVIGGANAGKTKSVGKPLLKNYIENNFAGFIYDMKDFDYTRSAYNLIQKNPEFKNEFYYMNFVDMSRTYRANLIDPALIEENIMLQLMSDVLSSYLGDGKKDEWFINALGVFKGVAMRFYYDYPQNCNLPTVVNYCVHNNADRITAFLIKRRECRALASGFIASQKSPKTQASILSSLTGYIADLAFNKKISYVLSGNDFDYNIIDPEKPKLITVSNSYRENDVISPVIGLMVKILSRHFTMENKVNAVFFLDEATTFKIDGFETMPSVLRDYKASFVLLTQSTAKLEKTYGKLDKQSLQANFGNVFYGSIAETTDIQNFSLLFSERDEKRISRSSGSSGGRGSNSVSVSVDKKKRYEPYFFKQLQPGEFVGVTSDSNVSEFHTKLTMYEFSEEEKDLNLPIVHHVNDQMIIDHYERLVDFVTSL